MHAENTLKKLDITFRLWFTIRSLEKIGVSDRGDLYGFDETLIFHKCVSVQHIRTESFEE